MPRGRCSIAQPGDDAVARGRARRDRQRRLARRARAAEARPPSLHGRRVGRRVRDLARRARAQVRGGRRRPRRAARGRRARCARARRDRDDAPVLREARFTRGPRDRRPRSPPRCASPPIAVAPALPPRARAPRRAAARGCSAWYELFPRSTGARGARHLARRRGRLDYVAELGFDIVYLPPIHPIGTRVPQGPQQHADRRPQDDPGSPWAIGARRRRPHGVHPELGTLADFDRFVAAASQRGLEVALDIAFQARPIIRGSTEHPELVQARAPTARSSTPRTRRRSTRTSIRSTSTARTGARCGTALRDVFVFWCERGVRVFRVDNPHTKPIPFWEWCIARGAGALPRRDLPRRGVHAAEADVRARQERASRSRTRTSRGARRSSSSRATLRELARRRSPISSARTSGRRRRTSFPSTSCTAAARRSCSALILAGTLVAQLRASTARRTSSMEHEPRPGVEELAHNEKYQLRDVGSRSRRTRCAT